MRQYLNLEPDNAAIKTEQFRRGHVRFQPEHQQKGLCPNWVKTRPELQDGAGKLFLWAALAASAWSSSAFAAAVDLELVIAADTSSSIDDREAALQRQGVAAAFRSLEVVRAISSGALGRIAVLYMDWSGGPNNKIVVNWRTIGDKASADAFADVLLKAPRTYGRGTSIGGAMEMGVALIATSGLDATRRAIDISGDGPSNMGRAPSPKCATRSWHAASSSTDCRS